jgi:hypothetical protein
LTKHLQARVLSTLDEPLDATVVHEILHGPRPSEFTDGVAEGYDYILLTPKEREFIRNYSDESG